MFFGGISLVSRLQWRWSGCHHKDCWFLEMKWFAQRRHPLRWPLHCTSSWLCWLYLDTAPSTFQELAMVHERLEMVDKETLDCFRCFLHDFLWLHGHVGQSKTSGNTLSVFWILLRTSKYLLKNTFDWLSNPLLHCFWNRTQQVLSQLWKAIYFVIDMYPIQP